MTGDLKAITRRTWEEIYPQCDEAGLVEVTAPDVVDHTARPGEPGGLEGARATMRWLGRVFSDQRWEVHQLIGEGDTVVVHATHHGTHTGDLMGIPATGRRVAYDHVHILRYRDGKAIEHWGYHDHPTLMAQLGMAPDSPPPVKPEATGAQLVVRWVEELFNARDLSVADDLIASTYIEHAAAPFGVEEPGPLPGPEGMRRTATWLLDQFPDLQMTIEALVAQDDVVVVRVLTTGTNLGPLNGVVPPTGRSFSARQTHWFRVDNGRLAEHWATRDDLPAMLQLGVIRPPGPPPGGPGATARDSRS